MARKSATSTSASASRGGKLPPTLPADGKTPRPPRRRKQQHQTTTQTLAAAQNLDDFSSSPDDEEYSFALSVANFDAPKSSRKPIPSRMLAIEKENSINGGGCSHRRSVDGGKECTRTTEGNSVGREQQRVAIATKSDADSLPRDHHPIQGLSDRMANVNLGRNQGDGSTKVRSLNASDSVHRMGPFPPKGFVSKAIMISTATSGSPKYILQNSLQTIEKSGNNDLVWKLFQLPSMMNVVVSESFSLGSSESMLLEENTTKLIDTAKRCLKSLSSSTSGKASEKLGHSDDAKNELDMALLRVALYSLRSILPTIIESIKSQSMVEVVIKLLYHCVVISGDACHGKFEAFTTTSTSSLSEKEGLAVIEYAMICLGAYEGLGKCLKTGGVSSMSKGGALSWDELIPLPDSEGASILSVTKILPHRLFVKIAMESAFCALSSFLNLSLMSLHAKLRGVSKLWAVPNEFHFVSGVINETCSGEYEEIATFQKLSLNVAYPFVMQSLYMAEEDNDAQVLIADAFRHVKKGFRVLWDGARSLENACTVNNSSALRICCLDLQSEAIHFVLRSLKSVLQSGQWAPSTVKEVLALFDRASSSAIKSAGVFQKATESDQSKKGALVHFHAFVGAQLDLVAMHLCSKKSCNEKTPLPSSYYEYCVYRSIHRWRLLGSFESEGMMMPPSLDKNLKKAMISGEAESMVSVSTLPMIHMVLEALQCLKVESEPVNITDSDCERVISNFELIVINNSTTASQHRCRSMLTLIDLQREASQIISFAQSETQYYANGSCIALLASVLWRCCAQLETKLSQSTKDQTRSLNFRLASADSCTKSAALFGLASEDPSLTSDKLNEYAINACTNLHKSYEMLLNELDRLEKNGVDRKAPTVLAIEIFAKAASFLGRRRYDKKEFWASLQPHIIASDVLARVAVKASDKELFNTYQISSRFMLLSSALDATKKYAESCAALALAAWCAIECSSQFSETTRLNEDESDEGDLIAEKILLFHETTLDSRSQDSVVFSGLSPVLTRLTRAYIQHIKLLKDQSFQDDRTLSAGITLTQALNNTMMEKVIVAASSLGENEDCSLGVIRFSKLLDCAIWNQKHYEHDLSAAQIAGIVREVLKSAIKVAKTDLTDDYELFLHVTEELKCFLQAQIKRLGNFIDLDSLEVLSSSFHVTFAVQLVDSQLFNLPRLSSWVLCKSSLTKQEFKILQLSCLHLQLADRQFVTAFMNKDNVQDACFFAQWAALQLYHAILLEHLSLVTDNDVHVGIESTISHSVAKQFQLVMKKYTLVLRNCSRAIDRLNESDEEAYHEVCESLLFTLKRLMLWFMYHGDQISAAGCFILLQKAYSFLVQSDHLLDAVVDFVSISSKFEDLVIVCCDHLDPKAFSSSESNDLLEEMIQRCLTLTSQIVGDSSVICSTTPELRRLLCRLCTCLDAEVGAKSESSNEAKMIDSVMVAQINLGIRRRLLVTAMLMLHAKLLLHTQPSTAVEYLGLCRAQCREFVRCLRLSRCCLNSMTFDDTAIQIDDMLTMCYERFASAFCLLGIRRKAEDHALLPVLKQQILSSSSFRQVEMQDLIELIDRYDGHECFLHLIRSLMKVKSLSSSPDTIASHHIVIKNIGSTLDFSSDDDSLRLNHIICKSKNVLACEFCHRLYMPHHLFHLDHVSHIRLDLSNPLIVDVSFQHVPGFRIKSQLDIDRVHKDLSQYAGQDNKDSIVSTTFFTKRVCDDLKLRIHHSIGSRLIGIDLPNSSIALLEEITGSKFSSGMCNAEAYYRLGLFALRSARKCGELQGLWTGNAVFLDEGQHKINFNGVESTASSTLEARKFFQCALRNAPPASSDLTKNILRCLALVTGPADGKAGKGLTAASLIHMSVGGSSRNIVRDELDRGRIRELFQTFEDESLDYDARIEALGLLLLNSGDLLPTNWNISTLATCPTGELIVSSIRTSLGSSREKVTKISTACIFPATGLISNDDSRNGIHTDILFPLDKIIERSQNQLHGMTEEVQHNQYDANSSRREWWKERHSFDDELQTLLQHAERKYFRHDPIKQSLLPDDLFCSERQSNSVFDDNISECSDLGPGNLESKFVAVKVESPKIPDFDKETEEMNLMKLTVAAIKSKLVSCGVPGNKIKKRNKSELVHLLLSEMENVGSSEPEEETNSINSAATTTVTGAPKCTFNSESDQVELGEPCTILILDEHLQRFPLESMDMLSNIAITRVPSLPFVLAILLESEAIHSTAGPPAVDPTKVKYVLDPESNLSETASTLGTALNSMASKNGWKWEGVAGRLPSFEFMSEALTEENGLYLFCGHGGGENSFSRSQVEALMKGRDDGIRGCRSSVVLMGCSSGKLQSVNTPKDNSTAYYTMHYEPEGIALSYLYAGAPCVVGNLWDVTDRDIDSCHFFPERSISTDFESLSDAVLHHLFI
ncbi:hypothetical protein ACHAW5_008650 [Stephanodiscus triporus]|uniref:separase n=1 Tax=Stephanodiscus triporus TaxID=2934178 RepID=A0ABD3MR65_9STRA